MSNIRRAMHWTDVPALREETHFGRKLRCFAERPKNVNALFAATVGRLRRPRGARHRPVPPRLREARPRRRPARGPSPPARRRARRPGRAVPPQRPRVRLRPARRAPARRRGRPGECPRAAPRARLHPRPVRREGDRVRRGARRPAAAARQRGCRSPCGSAPAPRPAPRRSTSCSKRAPPPRRPPTPARRSRPSSSTPRGRPAGRRARCSRISTWSTRCCTTGRACGSRPPTGRCSRCPRATSPDSSRSRSRCSRSAGCVITLREFKARAFLELAARERMTHTLVVPAIYNLCLRDPEFDRFDLSAWRIGGFGGASMPEGTIRALAEKLPGLTLMNAYGATETTSPTTIMPMGLQAAHLDSVGVVVPCGDVRVMDDAGREVAPGETGEIWIAGPMVVPGYWDNPEATAREFERGYWKSGDLGSIDARGFVRVFDRKKDLINRGGYKVYSAEVESVLSLHPAVVESALIAVPDPVLGEKARAIVVARDAGCDADGASGTLRAASRGLQGARLLHVPVRAAAAQREREAAQARAARLTPMPAATPADPVLHRAGRRAPRLRNRRQGPAARARGALDDPPRVRLGKPGLAPVAHRARARQHPRALRPARLRSFGSGRRRHLVRGVARRTSRRWSTRPGSRASCSSALRRAHRSRSPTRRSIRSA